MIGMLWYDNDPRTDIASKIYQAVDYYMQKYHARPNLCYVHPSMIVPKAEDHISGVEVRTSKQVRPNHFWLGVEKGE